MDKNNKLILPISILVASVIIGGFIYASQVSKQRSTEKQQRAELQLKRNELEAKEEVATKIEKAKKMETFQRASCASEAEEQAISMNNKRCDRGDYCVEGDNSYLVGQYDNSYNSCLQRKGLE